MKHALDFSGHCNEGLRTPQSKQSRQSQKGMSQIGGRKPKEEKKGDKRGQVGQYYFKE